MKKFFLLLMFAAFVSRTCFLNSYTSLQGHESNKTNTPVNIQAVNQPVPPSPLTTAPSTKPELLPRPGLMMTAETDSLVTLAQIEQFIISAANVDTSSEESLGNDNGGSFSGFFGTDHYRIEFHFAGVTRDKANRLLWHVSGKTRYKKAIMPFKGDIVFDSAFNERIYSYQYTDYKEDKDYSKKFEGDTFANYVHLKGHYLISQFSTKGNEGSFEGNIFMDLTKFEQEYRVWLNSDNETRNAGWLMTGNWTSRDAKVQKPLLLPYSIFALGNDVLKNFAYGEREMEINPKYRSLGWANYWSNDEWWDDSSTPPVSISGH